MDTRPPAKRTHQVAERPAVWVEIRSVRCPGREHGFRDHGRIRVVEDSVPGSGLRYYNEQPASRVTAR